MTALFYLAWAVVFAVASACLWLPLHNRKLAWMRDGNFKLVVWALTISSAVALPWLVAWLFGMTIAAWTALVILALYGLRRLHLGWLRRRYRHFSAARREDLPWRSSRFVTSLDLRLQHYRLTLDPRLRGLRIGHISDLHLDAFPPVDFYHAAFDRLAQQQPHLIAVTGDLVTRQRYLHLVSAVLGRLHAPLGVYAVRGNHDWYVALDAVAQQLHSAGVTLLNDRSLQLTAPSGQPFHLTGCEHPWGTSGRHFEHVPADGLPTIILTHLPDNFLQLAPLLPQLVLAGHNHAGQWRLPFVGALAVPAQSDHLFDHGHFQLHGAHLIVSAGLGTGFPPLRLCCRPEVALIECL